MTLDDDYDAFCEVLMGFAELKGRQLSGPAIELYWRAMQHWTLADFRAAAEQLLRTCEWMPLPQHFEELRKAARPVTAEAFLIARQVARTWRPHLGALTSGDVIIDHAVESIGGYAAIARQNLEFMGALEKRFGDAYTSITHVEAVRKAVPAIASNAPAPRLHGPQSSRNLLEHITTRAKGEAS